MKKIIATLLLVNSVVYAEVESVNFLEIGFEKWDYERPANPSVASGHLKFTEAKMSRADLSFNMKNKDQMFDAQMYWKNNIISFTTPFMNLDFGMGENSGFNDIKSISTKNSSAIINPLFFSFTGEDFSFGLDDMKLGLKNFTAFCTANDEELDMASAEGIEYGCMTEMSLNSNDYARPLELNMVMDYEDGDKLTFNANLSNIDLNDSTLIQAKATSADMTVSKYFVEMAEANLVCQKKTDMKVFDSEVFKKDCENTIDLTVPKIVVNNKTDDTKFYLETEEIKIQNEKLSFKAPVIQFVDKVSSVTTYDLELNCDKSAKATAYDLHSMIGECLKNGEVRIPRLVSRDEDKLWWSYGDILSKNVDPTSHIKSKEKDAADISIKMINKNVKLSANAYTKILGVTTKFHVDVKGQAVHLPEKDQIIIKVSDIAVPLGWIKIKWKKVLLGIMKKAIVGSMIEFQGDNIIIQL
ncbi:hypothetical protein [Bacteriovorax sp. Seq25_V]|uniref:hypothetical protein n=1 Tax=Bacteriovorax sp. Seq25_V TaxID=1201288 RepID=UPI00038A1163|nr:hypothetical protein [Bacteriovorax sp. Seq25_V]EQC46849.1 hypothetical protein M900_2655 [Bacteriovorax sp. Seq25_V]